MRGLMDIHCSGQNVSLFVDLLQNIFCVDDVNEKYKLMVKENGYLNLLFSISLKHILSKNINLLSFGKVFKTNKLCLIKSKFILKISNKSSPHPYYIFSATFATIVFLQILLLMFHFWFKTSFCL